MDDNDHTTLLLKLGEAIDSALGSWKEHLEQFANQQSYKSMIPEDKNDTGTKVRALKYLLETLPYRQAALTVSTGDPDLLLETLPEQCDNLLQELEDPASDIDLEKWFNHIFTNCRLLQWVAEAEKEIEALEQSRWQQLRMLKAYQAAFMEPAKDGEVSKQDLLVLVDGMKEVGVELIGFGFDVEGASIG